jgi:hypothetical protein
MHLSPAADGRSVCDGLTTGFIWFHEPYKLSLRAADVALHIRVGFLGVEGRLVAI